MGSLCDKCGKEPSFQDGQEQLRQFEDMNTVFGMSLLDLRPLSYYEELISANPSERINYIRYIVTATNIHFDYLFPADKCWFYLQKLKIIDNKYGYEQNWLEARILTIQQNYQRAIDKILKSQSITTLQKHTYKLFCNIYQNLGRITGSQLLLMRYLFIYPGDLFMMDLLTEYADRFQKKIIKTMICKYSALETPIFLPSVCKHFASNGKPEEMSQYINKHIQRDQQIAWHPKILSILIQLNDPTKIVQHLVMLRKKQKEYYYVDYNITLGRYSIMLGDRNMAEKIIKEIQPILNTISYKNVVKFLELLVVVGNNKRATEIYKEIIEPRMSDLDRKIKQQIQVFLAKGLLGEKELSEHYSRQIEQN